MLTNVLLLTPEEKKLFNSGCKQFSALQFPPTLNTIENWDNPP